MPISKYVAALALSLSMVSSAQAIDLSDPMDRLEAYIKAVGDLSGKTSIGYGKTTVYGKEPGKKGVPLFHMEVIGAGRWIPIEGGYRRLHKEVAFYTDLETGDILETWDNPLNGRTVEVFAVQNDPVNFSYFAENKEKGTHSVSYEQYGDTIVFHREVMLRYPSALPREDYPLHSPKRLV